jgi:hypothetical protein
MTKLTWIAVVVAGGLLVPLLQAQTTSGKALTLSQATREDWNEVGRKLIVMAEDFPEDKYDYKPVPAQRSFAEHSSTWPAPTIFLPRWRTARSR